MDEHGVETMQDGMVVWDASKEALGGTRYIGGALDGMVMWEGGACKQKAEEWRG